MSMNVYLLFNGNCEEAMNYYKEATGASIESLIRYGDIEMPSGVDKKNKVMHGIMLIADTKVMFSDAGDDKVVDFGNNFSLSLDYKEPKEMTLVFNALSKGGNVTMPLQETFWGAIFGMCTDKFGVNWMFNHDLPKEQH